MKQFINKARSFKLFPVSHRAKIDGVGPEPWRVTLVYGEAQIPERYKTWDTIKGLAATSNLSWIALGDFNEVLNLSKHNSIGNQSMTVLNRLRGMPNQHQIGGQFCHKGINVAHR